MWLEEKNRSSSTMSASLLTSDDSSREIAVKKEWGLV